MDIEEIQKPEITMTDFLKSLPYIEEDSIKIMIEVICSYKI